MSRTAITLLLWWLVTLAAPSAARELVYLVSELAAEPYQLAGPASRERQGLVTDIVSAALPEGSWSARPLPYRRLQRAISRHQYNPWLWYAAPAWMTESHRHHGVLIPVPLFKTRYQLVGREGGLADPVADAYGQRLLVIDGYHYGGGFASWVQARGHSLVPAPSHAHALAMLRQGRGDYYLAEDLRIRWEIERAGLGAADLECHSFVGVIPDAVIHLMVDKRLPLTERQALTRRLRELRDDGQLARLRERYGAAAP